MLKGVKHETFTGTYADCYFASIGGLWSRGTYSKLTADVSPSRGIDKAAISRANADTGTHSVSCEPSVTPIPAIPPDWKKVSIPGSSLTFGLPSDWEISESKAGRVTARKSVPTSDSASTEQLMKDIDKYGDWFVEVTIMEGVPATRLSLMKAMEGRVVQAEVVG